MEEINDLKRVKKEMIKDEEMYSISDFFKILGDSTRLKLLWALDGHELTVSALCEILGMTKSAISHQLKGLKDARLVGYKRSGKNIIYSLKDYHVRLIIETAREHLKEK